MKSDNLKLKDKYLRILILTKIKMLQQVESNSLKETNKREVTVMTLTQKVSSKNKKTQ